MTEAVARAHLARIDGNIAADRVSILEYETKAALLEKARQYEQQLYGKWPNPTLSNRCSDDFREAANRRPCMAGRMG